MALIDPGASREQTFRINLFAAYNLMGNKGGPFPQPQDMFVAAEFVLAIMKRILDPSDPLSSHLENVTAALEIRIHRGNERAAINCSGSATYVKSGVGNTECSKRLTEKKEMMA